MVFMCNRGRDVARLGGHEAESQVPRRECLYVRGGGGAAGGGQMDRGAVRPTAGVHTPSWSSSLRDLRSAERLHTRAKNERAILGESENTFQWSK